MDSHMDSHIACGHLMTSDESLWSLYNSVKNIQANKGISSVLRSFYYASIIEYRIPYRFYL